MSVDMIATEYYCLPRLNNIHLRLLLHTTRITVTLMSDPFAAGPCVVCISYQYSNSSSASHRLQTSASSNSTSSVSVSLSIVTTPPPPATASPPLKYPSSPPTSRTSFPYLRLERLRLIYTHFWARTLRLFARPQQLHRRQLLVLLVLHVLHLRLIQRASRRVRFDCLLNFNSCAAADFL